MIRFRESVLKMDSKILDADECNQMKLSKNGQF